MYKGAYTNYKRGEIDYKYASQILKKMSLTEKNSEERKEIIRKEFK